MVITDCLFISLFVHFRDSVVCSGCKAICALQNVIRRFIAPVFTQNV